MESDSIKSLSRPSQLLLRNIDVINGERILVIGIPEAQTMQQILQFFPDANITVYEYDYAPFRRIKSFHDQTVYGPWYTPEAPHDTIIIYLPKSDALIEYVFHLANNSVAPGGTIYVIGEKNAGIKSIKKDVEKYFGQIQYSDSARHSTIYGSTMAQSVIPNNGIEKYELAFTVSLNGTEITVISLPGVFSHGRLDEGTQFLLENITLPESARILDWGCGAGVIGAYIKQRFPKSAVEMVDSNALAIAAARKTVEANNLTGVLVYPSDIFSDVTEKYDMIISNPPFHSGIETNYSMAERFIDESYNHLEPRGRLLIVANTFLRYRPLIEKRFNNCKVVAENRRYRLYEALR